MLATALSLTWVNPKSETYAMRDSVHAYANSTHAHAMDSCFSLSDNYDVHRFPASSWEEEEEEIARVEINVSCRAAGGSSSFTIAAFV